MELRRIIQILLLTLLPAVLHAGEQPVVSHALLHLYQDRLNDDRDKAMEYAEQYLYDVDLSSIDTATVRICADLAEWYGTERYIFSKAEHWGAIALNAYRRLGEERLSAVTESKLAKLYYQQYKYHKALKHAVSALKYFEAHDDAESALDLYNLLGAIFYMCGDNSTAQSYMQTYQDLAQELQDSVAIALALNNMAIYCEDTATQHKLTEEAIRICGHTDDTVRLGKIVLNAAGTAIHSGDLRMAGRFLDQSRPLLSNVDLSGYYNYLKASLLYKEGDYAKAADTVARAIDFYSGTEFFTAQSLCWLLSNDIHLALGDTVNAYNALTHYHSIDPALFNVNTYVELFKYQHELIRQSEREAFIKDSHNRIAVASIFALAFIILLSLFLSKWTRDRDRIRRQNHVIRNYQIENQRYENDIRYKTESIEAKKVQQYRASRLASEISDRLRDLNREVKDQDIRNRINSIRNDLQNMEGDRWKPLDKYMPELDSPLMKKLLRHFPNLTVNERRLCVFLNMNLSTKEISDITRQSIQSINTARTRMRSKLGLTGKNISIQEFLSSLE
ncbi:MAG TPA: hypothetical protein IAC04_04790 [Candidatus Coprenecus stercoravium]|uniref:HTH luxR-type domain-containing protein n=1 Tax=Candidatus Coprenecus stercoravium TaxID=2840735 RepID=A0A9D2K8T6_9BACT|nr:hypothetical protein [Candidatus Coprenecus stercoravium]